MNESFIQSLDRLTPHNKAIFTVYNVIWGEERVLFLCIWQFQNKCTWFYSTPAVTFSVAIFTLKKQNMFTNIYCSDSLLACFCVLHVSMTACDVRVCVCVCFSHLAQNPFICDCHLKWLADYLQDNPIETSGARCTSPRRLANKRIGQIKSKKFRCSGINTLYCETALTDCDT